MLGKSNGDRQDISAVIRQDKNKYINIYKEWESATLTAPLNNIYLNGNLVFNIAQELLEISAVLSKHKIPARVGVFVGEIIDGKRFEPAHSLAMSLKAEEVKNIEVDRVTALDYLRGRTFDCPENLSGWHTVNYLGYPLGWCKAVNGVAKNHLPKGLRI